MHNPDISIRIMMRILIALLVFRCGDAVVAAAEESDPVVHKSLTRAESLLSSVEEDVRQWCLVDLAKSYACAGEFDEAFRISRQIHRARLRDGAISRISEELAARGRFSDAREVAAQSGEDEDDAWSEIAYAYGRQRRWDDAKSCLNQVSAELKGPALLQLAVVAAAGERNVALELIAEAKSLPPDPDFPDATAIRFMEAYLAVGETMIAMRVCNDYVNGEGRQRSDTDYLSMEAASLFSKYGHLDEALEILERVDAWRLSAIDAIVDWTLDRVDWEGVIDVFTKLQGDEDAYLWRPENFRNAVERALAAGNISAAERIVSQYGADRLERCWGWATIAAALSAAGRAEEALKLAMQSHDAVGLNEVVQLANEVLPDHEWAVEICVALSQAFRSVGKDKEAALYAETAGDLCLPLIREKMISTYVTSIIKTADALRAVGAADRSERLLRDSWNRIVNGEYVLLYRLGLLERLSLAMVRNGQREEVLSFAASLKTEQCDILSCLCRDEVGRSEHPTELPEWIDGIDDSVTRFYVILEGTKTVLQQEGIQCQ